MKQQTKALAIGGLLAALAVSLMCLGTLIPVATYCCPMLADLMLIAVLDLCGMKLGACWYLTVSLLSFFLAPDREAALLFFLLGYYPLIKPWIDTKKPGFLRLIIKVLIFIFAVFLLQLLLAVLGLDSLASEYGTETWFAILIVSFYAVGLGVFFLFDRLLTSMTLLWKRRLRRKLHI